MEQWAERAAVEKEDNPFVATVDSNLRFWILNEPRVKSVTRQSAMPKLHQEKKRILLGAASLGALMIIGPIAVFLYVPMKIVSLAVACGCVVLVAVGLTQIKGLRSRDMLASIAAYVSVLAVFIGTNNSNKSSSTVR